MYTEHDMRVMLACFSLLGYCSGIHFMSFVFLKKEPGGNGCLDLFLHTNFSTKREIQFQKG